MKNKGSLTNCHRAEEPKETGHAKQHGTPGWARNKKKRQVEKPVKSKYSLDLVNNNVPVSIY